MGFKTPNNKGPGMVQTPPPSPEAESLDMPGTILSQKSISWHGALGFRSRAEAAFQILCTSEPGSLWAEDSLYNRLRQTRRGKKYQSWNLNLSLCDLELVILPKSNHAFGCSGFPCTWIPNSKGCFLNAISNAWSSRIMSSETQNLIV